MPIGFVAHTHLPYCLHKSSDGRWLVLNRNYKPLGTLSQEWVDYDTHPARLKLHPRTVAAIAKAATNVISDKAGNPEVIYFYDDGCIPTDSTPNWNAYSKQLSRVMHAKV